MSRAQRASGRGGRPLPAALAPEQLRARFPAESLPVSTLEIAPLEHVTGQDRAQEAIRFGLGLPGDGYNIAVSGAPSSGRSTAVQQLVAAAAATREPGPDWVYLNNFADPSHPRAASLPAGMGAGLQKALARLADVCRNDIPKAFENETYQERSQKVLEPLHKARDKALEEMQRSASQQGFVVNVTPMGFVVMPMGQDGRLLSPEVIAGLPADLRAAIEKRSEGVEETVSSTVRELRKIDSGVHDAIDLLDRDVARFVVGHILDDLREKFGPFGLSEHLDAIESDILLNLERFKQLSQTALHEMPAQVVAQVTEEREALLRRYKVNLFVTRADGAAGAPVVEERSPTYLNLLGRVDYEAHFGSLTTDFTQIRAGAMHRANSGYLVVHLEELLSDARSWAILKRALKTRELRIEGVGEMAFPLPIVNLVPAPIPFSAKVVLIGEPLIMALLELVDPDFRQLFKIHAEFEPDSPLSAESVQSYAAFARRTTDVCGLKPFTRSALAELVHYGSRLASRQDRLSTRYGAVADLCQEAGHIANTQGAVEVDAGHVLAAIDGRRARASLVPDRLRRMITEGTLRVETEGRVVGQVNGLAVYEVGAYAFGTPVRITCRTGIGRLGVVAIEREVERSGAIHTKGVLVLSGYLTGTFGSRRQLAFTASLTFEQSYDEVEGDSASSAELYAILCSLAGIPARQDVGVTGSVDQLGRVQAVGGVTEKVEGFFDVCSAAGLSGTQGVIIPATNVVNLSLRPDIVEAVREGRFHIWPISAVAEGLEILTGMPAGAEGTPGTYAEGTVFRAVDEALDAMQSVMSAETLGTG
jgi:predicted ATP-dependent protease